MILQLLPAVIGALAVLALLVLVVCALIAGGRADDRLEAARRVERVPGRVVSLELERARRRRTVA